MGTSSKYPGPGSDTPLVPDWLEPDRPAGPPEDEPEPDPGDPPTPPPDRPAPIPPPTPHRFRVPRSNFSRFVNSGGEDRRSLGRAVRGYVRTGTGGATQAARRMGASRASGQRLLSFLADARERGPGEALRALNLEDLADQPIQEVFLGLVEYICPLGGTVDDGIARDAFIETIAELASTGVTDLDDLTGDEIRTVLELYTTHTIEKRLYNDIGLKHVDLPPNAAAVSRIERQVREFIRRGVSDAYASINPDVEALTVERVSEFVESLYQTSFAMLEALGEQAAEG